MSDLLDVLGMFDVINRVEGIVSSFIHADWNGALRKGGAFGVAGELMSTAAGGNRWKIWVSRLDGWNGVEIERYLRKYGVVIWDRGFLGDDYYFSVKKRQANWAEYLLLRRGLTITGPYFNPDNVRHGERYAPGDAPPAWVDRDREPRSTVDRLADWLP